jgi:hypothetical protein
LFRQRALEREEVGELSGTGFPYGSCAAEITVLLKERQPKTGLTRNRSFGWLL